MPTTIATITTTPMMPNRMIAPVFDFFGTGGGPYWPGCPGGNCPGGGPYGPGWPCGGVPGGGPYGPGWPNCCG
ncbi:hypothetical protein GCM10027258_04410 [Amycolatopsis stemonae]